MLRVGILTSGGDCQALNATMRGTAKSLYRAYGDNVEIIGFKDGYKGLMYRDYTIMHQEQFSGLLTRGGTILGTSRQPFKLMRVIGEDGFNKVEAMKDTYKKLKLDCLVILGGNGSQKTANLLSDEGLNIIGLPKTIDNDIYKTDITFGFYSAVRVASGAIDDIHTTAASHGRVFVVEVMGHKVGWITLYAGLASGADIILIPEIPYDIDVVAEAVERRAKSGKKFSIIAVAEGAISKEDAKLEKKERKEKIKSRKYPSVAYEISARISELTGQEVRVTVPGHMQRGGIPSPMDRVISTRIGAKCADMIQKKDFGKMIAIKGENLVGIPLAEIAGKLKTINPKADIIKEARLTGISFGDTL